MKIKLGTNSPFLAKGSANELSTFDAIFYSTQIFSLYPSNNAKKFIFVFTDGNGTRGLHLTSVLNEAEKQNIIVIACDISKLSSQSPPCSFNYQHWISCPIPKHFSKALKLWSSGANPPKKLSQVDEISSKLLSSSNITFETIWKNHLPAAEVFQSTFVLVFFSIFSLTIFYSTIHSFVFI